MTRRTKPINQFRQEPYKTAQKMMRKMAAGFTRNYRSKSKTPAVSARGSAFPAGEPMPSFGFSHDDAEWLDGDQWTPEEIEELKRMGNEREERFRVNRIKTAGR